MTKSGLSKGKNTHSGGVDSAANDEVLTVLNQKFQKKIHQLQELNERLNNIIQSMEIGAIVVDEFFKIRMVSPVVHDYFNLKKTPIGLSINNIPITPDLYENLKYVIQKQCAFEKEIKINGIWHILRIAPCFKKNRVIDGAIITFINIHTSTTNLESAEDKLYHIANFDELTKLPNRSAFLELMSDEIKHSMANNLQFVLLFMDLDNFKRVNDSLGHTIGDALLQEVANILKKITRRHDIIARLGGDEFAIIIKNVQSIDVVQQITGRYIQAFAQCLSIHGHEIKTSTSIGLALFPQFGRTPYELLQNADAAMYYAKQHGKNNYYFFDQRVKDKLIRRHAIDTQLQHSLEKKEFSLVYQLKFNLKTGEPTGVEALIRWKNEKLGDVYPDEFIPIAEENRLIVPIGYWLVDQVIRDYRKLSKLVDADSFLIAVNMSMIHLSEPDFEYQVKQLLFAHNFFSPNKLIFELTETALMEHPKLAAKILRNISSMGIKFALDDFGTGYSSMQHIKNFPISSLKIDKSFISDLSTDHSVVAMVKAMIAFTKILGMNVTAEGVETQKQLSFLKKEGCDEVQGFLLSKPLKLVDLVHFLKQVKM
jgi:diguanylate cyclase (GGDEF)-like protein